MVSATGGQGTGEKNTDDPFPGLKIGKRRCQHLVPFGDEYQFVHCKHLIMSFILCLHQQSLINCIRLEWGGRKSRPGVHPVSGKAGEDVKVEVADALLRRGAAGMQAIHAGGADPLESEPRELLNRRRHGVQNLGRGIEKVLDVGNGCDDRVARHLGTLGDETNRLPGSEDHARRGLAANEQAERALTPIGRRETFQLTHPERCPPSGYRTYTW